MMLLFVQIIELEAMQGNPDAIEELRKEMHHWQATCENLENELKQRNCDVELLKKRLDEQCQIYGSSNQKVDDKIKVKMQGDD